jgi:hypothetical protein
VLRALLRPLLALIALSGTGQATAANALFCCNDEHGKQVCGDLLPQACYGRAYREIGSSGRTLRNVEAPLTAEQRAQRAAEEATRKAQETALKEQKRKDQALLDTYGTEKDIATLKLRAEQDVNRSIKAAEAKIAEAQLQRKKFEDEAEFYKKKQLPPEIAKGLRDLDYEIAAQQSVIASKKKDLEVIGQKFEEDRRRFLELSRGTVIR